MEEQAKKVGVYAGSFDPVTLGHLDIIRRASKLFDRLYVGVLINKSKKPLFSADERVKIIQSVTGDLGNVYVTSFEGLSIDFAKSVGAHVLVRGLRAISDFEHELQMAQTNNAMSPEIDTIFFATDLKYAYLSSSIVKEVASFDGNIGQFVPAGIVPLIKEKLSQEKEEQQK